ncbi:hypothetical protein VTK26DRAFT_5513 [Humicola hyalothermophila]
MDPSYPHIDSEDIATDPFDEDDSQDPQELDSPQTTTDSSGWPADSSSPAASSAESSDDRESPRFRHSFSWENLDSDSEGDRQWRYVLEQVGLGSASDEDHDLDSPSDLFSENDLNDDDSDNMSLHSHPAPRDASSEAPSDDDLFVEQREPRLPPIDDFFPPFGGFPRAVLADIHTALAEGLHENPRRTRNHNRSDDIPRQRLRMAHRRSNRNVRNARDELIAVEVEPARDDHAAARAEPEVIDLTGEPDSPDEPRARPSHAHPPRNGNRNAPRQEADVIDLTLDDSPAPAPRPQRLPPIVSPPLPNPLNMPRAQYIDLEDEDEFGARLYGIVSQFARPGLNLLNRIGGVFGHQPQDVEVQIIRADGSVAIPNPLRQNIPNLNYRGNGRRSSSSGGGSSGAGGPKPAYIPPPPAREGFTRATTGGNDDDDDNQFVCASCEQELQYDPDEAPPATKKARTRKDQEEHHFWALKDCGHVYCRDCFEHRKAAKNPSIRFRRGGENNKVLLCAVDDCESEVANKGAWVGLFV